MLKNKQLTTKMKQNFPFFKKNPETIYLDNAATTQKPEQAITAINNFYTNTNANIHRGIYDLSEKATQEYENSRKIIADFINASPKEIIFTSGTTDSLNILTNSLPQIFKNKKEIILTEMEHHSNIVPWQEAAKKHNMKIKFIKIKQDLTLDYKHAEKIINKNTAIISLCHISNSLGTINNIKKISQLAKKHNAILILDAAQSVGKTKVDVRKLRCDFLVFSGHKTFAPTGIGVLYGKYSLLQKIPPVKFGGDMINSVSFKESTFQNPPQKFEAGTQNISGAIALGQSIKFINQIGLRNIERQEKALTKYTIKELKKLKDITIYSSKNSAPIISFNLKNIHPHDVAQILNDYKICIRAGHHCCMPLMSKLKIAGTARISLSIYNTKQDIDKTIQALKHTQEIFK